MFGQNFATSADKLAACRHSSPLGGHSSLLGGHSSLFGGLHRSPVFVFSFARWLFFFYWLKQALASAAFALLQKKEEKKKGKEREKEEEYTFKKEKRLPLSVGLRLVGVALKKEKRAFLSRLTARCLLDSSRCWPSLLQERLFKSF